MARRRIGRLRLLTAVAAAGSLAAMLSLIGTGSASAAVGGPFENYNSGQCLGIESGADDAGAVQWPCNGNPDQQWHFGAAAPGTSDFFQIINGDGMCLGVDSESTSQGARVVGWSCNGNPDQYWSVKTVEGAGSCDGWWFFSNMNSGLVIGVAGNSIAPNTEVIQWDYQGQCNNQFWEYLL